MYTYNMYTYVYIDISTSIYVDIYFFCILYIYCSAHT